MGTDNLKQVGQTQILKTDLNQLVKALNGDLISRNSSGASFNGAGSLGENDKRFSQIFAKKLSISEGTAESSLINLEKQDDKFVIKLNGEVVLNIDADSIQSEKVNQFGKFFSSRSQKVVELDPSIKSLMVTGVGGGVSDSSSRPGFFGHFNLNLNQGSKAYVFMREGSVKASTLPTDQKELVDFAFDHGTNVWIVSENKLDVRQRLRSNMSYHELPQAVTTEAFFENFKLDVNYFNSNTFSYPDIKIRYYIHIHFFGGAISSLQNKSFLRKLDNTSSLQTGLINPSDFQSGLNVATPTPFSISYRGTTTSNSYLTDLATAGYFNFFNVANLNFNQDLFDGSRNSSGQALVRPLV